MVHPFTMRRGEGRARGGERRMATLSRVNDGGASVSRGGRGW
jgi:hypothetical protein